MQTGQFANAPDAVRCIVAKEGARGLYAVLHIYFTSICYMKLLFLQRFHLNFI
jgi:hypothetical protein